MHSSIVLQQVVERNMKKVLGIIFLGLFCLVCIFLFLKSSDNDCSAVTIHEQANQHSSKKYYDKQGKWTMTLYHDHKGNLVRSDKADGSVTIYDHDHQTTTIISNSDQGFRKAVHMSLYGMSETIMKPLPTKSQLQSNSK